MNDQGRRGSPVEPPPRDAAVPHRLTRMTDSEPLPTGLLVLHGNRLEDLAGAVAAWLWRHPLAALDEETISCRATAC